MKPPEPYRACSCRDPDSGLLLGPACPKLGQKGHGAWYARYETPRGADGRRRPRIGPYATKKAASEALADALGRVRQGAHIEDRRTTFGDYLARRLRWWQAEPELKPSTLTSYREAIDLYFRPGLGHVRLTDLRDSHFRDLYAAMRAINRPERQGGPDELLRRLTEARATARHLPGRLASTRPLSEARIRRVHAVTLSALSSAVPHTLPYNPAAAVKLGGKRGARKARPLLWTEPRVQRWRETGEIPAPVMVWTAAQCGAFLDSLEASDDPSARRSGYMRCSTWPPTPACAGRSWPGSPGPMSTSIGASCTSARPRSTTRSIPPRAPTPTASWSSTREPPPC
jgi:Phage integrase, N-terminal SAM-like domain